MSGSPIVLTGTRGSVRAGLTSFVLTLGDFMKDRRWRLRVIYSGILLVAYFGFFLMCAFLPERMAAPALSNSPISFAMLLGATIIVGLIAMTGLYTVSADRA
jgi:uncharacterized membrane protein (DUF485 family)